MSLVQNPRGLSNVATENPTQIFDELQSLVPSSSFPESYPTIPGYEIVSLIGQGGMSNVYLARQTILNRMVAIKMIRPQDRLNDNYRRRFVREASSIACLRHPNVVQIYEIGEAENMLYICLEYVPGGNLASKIQQERPTPRVSAEIVRQLSGALEAAHKLSIIHRDLKPANVLWDDREAGGSSGATSEQLALDTRIAVKITDFGLAKVLSENSDQTKSGFVVGTPSYMSPEQTSGDPENIGTTSDIYGLGVILYELLTGEPPFQGATAMETIRLVRLEPPKQPSRLNRAVPADLERICLQCLEKRPEDRYASADELGQDLSRFLNGFAVTAHRPPRYRKWLRQCRRHPLRVLAVALIAALSIVVSLLLLNSNRSRPDGTVPEVVPATPSLPPEVRQALSRIRENPKTQENVHLLTELGNDWLVRLAQDFPEDFAVQYGLGEAYFSSRDPDRALIHFERARRLTEVRAKRDEGGFETWANLADIRERIGDIQLIKKDRQAAISAYEKSIETREMLQQEEPRVFRWAMELAATERKQAELYVADREYSTAIQLYDRRRDLLQTHLAENPQLGASIRESHQRIAELYEKLGNKQKAIYHQKAAKAFPAGGKVE